MSSLPVPQSVVLPVPQIAFAHGGKMGVEAFGSHLDALAFHTASRGHGHWSSAGPVGRDSGGGR